MTRIHTFKKGDVIVMWFDTGAMGADLCLGIVIAAGPKTYRVRWESGITNRVEQGRTICWLHDWRDWTADEKATACERLGISS